MVDRPREWWLGYHPAYGEGHWGSGWRWYGPFATAEAAEEWLRSGDQEAERVRMGNGSYMIERVPDRRSRLGW